MKIINSSISIKKPLKNAVLTMGNFDGVHLGHQKIFGQAIARAKKIKGTSVVYTFWPHPVKLIAPLIAPRLLQTQAQKLSSIEGSGINICIVEPFTEKLAQLTYREFFDTVILKKVRPREMIVGYDFTFGLHRHGTVEHLETLAKNSGIKIRIVGAIFLKGALLSSTQVRNFVSDGKIEEANRMLGRPYELAGRVVRGRGIGGAIGFHTANMVSQNELIPPTGVYATRTCGRMSVTNIGFNPTFGGSKLALETHILNFSGDILGKDIEVAFYKRLRDEKKFDSPELLTEQIKLDIKRTKSYLARQ